MILITNNIGFIKYTVVLLSLSLSSHASFRGTGLNLEYTKQYLNNSNCQSSEKKYIACLVGIQAIASFSRSKVNFFLPSEVETRRDQIHLEVQSFAGGLKHVILKSADLNIPLAMRGPDLINGELTQQSRDNYWYTFNRYIQEIKQLRMKNQGLSFEHLLDLALLEVPKDVLQDALATGLNSYFGLAIEAHTRLMPGSEFFDSQEKSGQEFAGIGLGFEMKDQKVVVNALNEGAPALRAGILKGDVLISVDGHSVQNLNADEIIAKIRGPIGSTVEVKVVRISREIVFRIVRQKIEIPNLEVKAFLYKNQTLLHIRIRSFSEARLFQKLRAQLRSFQKQNPSGYIIDLRGNLGGDLRVVTLIAGLFVNPDSNIVLVGDLATYQPGSGHSINELEGISPKALADQTVKMNLMEGLFNFGQFVTNPNFRQKLADNEIKFKADPEFGKPIVILQDAYSASASEILSGALRDLGNAMIVGQDSFGKGTVQQVLPQEDSDRPSFYLAQTTAIFYQPDGTSNQGVGIKADFKVGSSPDTVNQRIWSARELDFYPLGLQPMMNAPKGNPNHGTVSRVRRCINVSEPNRIYNVRQAHPQSNVDYQLYYSMEVLNCHMKVQY